MINYDQTLDICKKLKIDIANINGEYIANNKNLPSYLYEAIKKHGKFIFDHFNKLDIKSLTKEKLKYYAGEDWKTIKDDSEKIKIFTELVFDYILMLHGEIPQDYTATTYCQCCKKIVSVPQKLTNGGSVFGCMWCAIRGIKKTNI